MNFEQALSKLMDPHLRSAAVGHILQLELQGLQRILGLKRRVLKAPVDQFPAVFCKSHQEHDFRLILGFVERKS